MDGLLETLKSKFRPQHNEASLSLQYCKLSRQNNENSKQWGGRLRIMAAECNYKELDRYLKQQCINGLNDDDMMVEIILEFTSLVDTTSVASEQILVLTK